MRTIETHYLIDYENVHSDGLTGCKDLSSTDHIIIFFTDNAKNIDMTNIFDHGDATLDMEKVPAGNQSADMHIISYLGFLAGNFGKSCKVVIVSKDTDFDNVINYWKSKTGINASRTQQIKAVKPKQVSTPTKQHSQTSKQKVSGEKKTKLNQEVMQAIRKAGYDATVANTVAQIATGLYGDEHMLSEVHNALKERYTDYLDVYSAAKPVLSKYADSGVVQKPKVNSKVNSKASINSEIQKLLSKAGFSNEIIAYVTSTAVKNLGVKNGKQQTYRSIISKYGQAKGLNIYNHIKKHI